MSKSTYDIDRWGEIVIAIKKYSDGVYKANLIGEWAIEINFEGKPSKFIVYEPQICYTNIEEAVTYFRILTDLKSKTETNAILMIPFFSAVTGTMLGEFILGETINIAEELELTIEFNTFPSDFNTQGSTSFMYHLGDIQVSVNIEGNPNSFNEYVIYFAEAVNNVGGRINLILPVIFLEMFPHSAAISSLFEEIKTASEMSDN